MRSSPNGRFLNGAYEREEFALRKILPSRPDGRRRVSPGRPATRLARTARDALTASGSGFPAGSLCGVFDHVGIAVTDLAASERFYRTVLSALGAEPSHADAELVEWEDWDIGVTDREHPVTRAASTSASE